MSKRDRVGNVEAGHKANACKTAMFGPGELERAGNQAAWTRGPANSNKADNPHVRERVYSSADMDRVKRFIVWHKANPTLDHAENPHSWSNTQGRSDAAHSHSST